MVIEQYGDLKSFGLRPWEVNQEEPTREDLVYLRKCQSLYSEFADRFQKGGDSSLADRVRGRKRGKR